jgi:hypothetical protein
MSRKLDNPDLENKVISVGKDLIEHGVEPPNKIVENEPSIGVEQTIDEKQKDRSEFIDMPGSFRAFIEDKNNIEETNDIKIILGNDEVEKLAKSGASISQVHGKLEQVQEQLFGASVLEKQAEERKEISEDEKQKDTSLHLDVFSKEIPGLIQAMEEFAKDMDKHQAKDQQPQLEKSDSTSLDKGKNDNIGENKQLDSSCLGEMSPSPTPVVESNSPGKSSSIER